MDLLAASVRLGDGLSCSERLINRSQIYVLPLSSYDVKTTRAEVRIPSDVVTAIAFRKDHPGSYIGSTTLGIAFVDEKNGAIQMLKRKRLPRQRPLARMLTCDGRAAS